MLGALAATPISEASAPTPPAFSIALSSASMYIPFKHERDCYTNTIVFQEKCVITDVNTISERLKTTREALKLSQEQLASLAHVSQGTIGNVESGARKNPRELLAIAKALNVNPEWLKSGEGPKEAPIFHADFMATTSKGLVAIELKGNSDYPSIRRVALKAQAGVTGYAIEFLDEDGPPIVFRKDWYIANNYKPEKMLAMRVSGESMVPSLVQGDLIVINSAQTEPKDGRPFVVNYEGEIIVKRLVRDAGQWWLTSDNPDQRRYPKKVCDSNTEIVGQVVYRQTEEI